MTTLGKILVVVNFVFTLVTGALIIMVFSVRTNWKVGYDKLKKNYEVSQANVTVYAGEVQSIKKASDDRATELANEIAKLKKERDEYVALNDKLKKDIVTQVDLAKSAGVSTQTS